MIYYVVGTRETIGDHRTIGYNRDCRDYGDHRTTVTIGTTWAKGTTGLK